MKKTTFKNVKAGQIFEGSYGKCMRIYRGIYHDRDHWMTAEDKAPVSAIIMEGENVGRPIRYENDDVVTLYDDMVINFKQDRKGELLYEENTKI